LNLTLPHLLAVIKKHRFALKSIFVLGFCYWIFIQINRYLETIGGEGNVIGEIDFRYIFLVAALVPLNWYLEALKWRRLCKPYCDISLRVSLKAVMSGVTLGLITPARIGEYGGRMLLTPISNKANVIAATFTGSVAQNMCNVGLGIGLSLPLLNKIIATKFISLDLFYIVIVGQVILLVLIFFNLRPLLRFVRKYVGKTSFSVFADRFSMLPQYTNHDLWYVLIISMCRYLLYFAQYSMTMYAFVQTVDFLNLISAISAIYLIQSLLPLPTFISLFARGELAIIVWSNFMISPIVAICATFSLWISNLILPAIVGLYILIKNDYWSIPNNK
jgi:hypothetical protein